MRISDWSSDVCSSDLTDANDHNQRNVFKDAVIQSRKAHFTGGDDDKNLIHLDTPLPFDIRDVLAHANFRNTEMVRSEEHTSELQSLMRISYAVFCLKKKITRKQTSVINTSTKHYNYINN